MALTYSNVFEVLLSSRMQGALPLNGPSYELFAQGFASSFLAWVTNPVSVKLTGWATGSAGTGIVNPSTTVIFAPSDPMRILEPLQGVGLDGQIMPSLAQVLAQSVTAIMAQAQYSGFSSAVAVGLDNSTITLADPLSLQGLLLSYWGERVVTQSLSLGVAVGVASLLLGAPATGSVSGVPVIPGFPTTGPTTSMVI